MSIAEKWIWLPQAQYPLFQNCPISGFSSGRESSYCVAEFQKTWSFDQTVTEAELRFSGDTEFQLFCNDELVATGPASVGGDFFGNEEPRDNFYAYKKDLAPNCSTLSFLARVKMTPVRICDYSRGHGGFMLQARIRFADGTMTVLTTDSSWMARRCGAYQKPFYYDGRIAPDAWLPAEQIDNIWHTETAPIPPRQETRIVPTVPNTVLLAPGEKKTVSLPLDRIYAGFITLDAQTGGVLKVQLHCREIQEEGYSETVIFDGSGSYRGFQLHSVGNLEAELQNESAEMARCRIGLIATCYPVTQCCCTHTSDPELDLMLDVCRHTLQYCRQTHHLDSPRHCEPLACTGDYYIESLMTMFSFGDMRLAEFDIRRTAKLLEDHDGRMFHTAYSLIWVQLLWDVFKITGHEELLQDCREALILLLQRFRTYLGSNGLLETPPDYMFVDWIYIDGISLHHPPKALGQTVLNLFYFNALQTAAEIYSFIQEPAMARRCSEEQEALRNAINTQLYDQEKGLYFEGLNTKTPDELLRDFMPQNTDKRYYLKQSNILAACFGVCSDEKARDLIHKIMSDECPGDYQPYFAHFLLEAIRRCGLRERYTIPVLNRWKQPVKDCPKGLVEGFLPPEPTYCFDHSHAWGGTPLYSLPMALLGLSILKPGMTELSLRPSLLGREEAVVELPTPYGVVTCRLKQGQLPEISHPKEITVHLEEE